jgi:hypothetical protein
MNGMLKGVVNVEFILALLVFVTTLVFITTATLSSIPNIHEQAISEKLKTNIYSVSEIIMFDKGYPENWDSTTVQKIGLSSGQPYILSIDKINNLSELCRNDYQKMLSALNLENYNIIINITRDDGTNILYCKPRAVTMIRPTFYMKRTAVVENNIATLEVFID